MKFRPVHIYPFLGALYGAVWATAILTTGALAQATRWTTDIAGDGLQMLSQRLVIGLPFAIAAGALMGAIIATARLNRSTTEAEWQLRIPLFVSSLVAVIAVTALVGGLWSPLAGVLARAGLEPGSGAGQVAAALYPVLLLVPAVLTIWFITHATKSEQKDKRRPKKDLHA